ncbi:MAG: alanine racemase [Bacillota bacterium]
MIGAGLMRPTWAEINLDHIAHNVNEFRRHLGPRVEIMAVVKADGYGHGAVETARAALEAGASRLAVALPEEGLELRRAGITAPILVFGYTVPELAPHLYQYGLTPALIDRATASAFNDRLSGLGERLAVHVKVDTGMGRVGVSPAEAVEVIAAIASLPGLYLEGVFTHLAAADEADRSFTDCQLRRFNEILEGCRSRGLRIPLRHAANSAAAIAYPEARYDLIRLGISLYGCYPSPVLREGPVRLLPALSLKSRIVFLKEVSRGTPIGYGCTYRTAGPALIATVPAGYADGYSRRFSNTGQVLVRGQLVPVVGRVCMDQIMINVTGVPAVARGDEVVIYGRQGNGQISVDAAAETAGTINYELLCAVGKRVPRFYLRGGAVVGSRGLPEELNK